MRVWACAVLAALMFAPPAAAHTDAVRQLSFSWPADGTITSPYGRDGYRWHSGLDIGILDSLTVRAAAPGVVTRVGYIRGYEGYGNVVLERLGGGYSALYAHLSSPLVRVGQRLNVRDPLGIAGCTGWCTGTHLHFELRYRGRAVDPTRLFRALH